MRKAIIVGAILAITGGLSAFSQQSPTQPPSGPWGGCCGASRWPVGPGMMGPWGLGPSMMGRGMIGSMPRHRYAMVSGIPAPYSALSNPLPRTAYTIERGAKVYEQNCTGCHGATGAGNGPAAQTLYPPPANLVWVSQLLIGQWDSFMYWAVGEGGAQFGTAMPAFKDSLSKDDIWAAGAYVQAHLPQKPAN